MQDPDQKILLDILVVQLCWQSSPAPALALALYVRSWHASDPFATVLQLRADRTPTLAQVTAVVGKHLLVAMGVGTSTSGTQTMMPSWSKISVHCCCRMSLSLVSLKTPCCRRSGLTSALAVVGKSHPKRLASSPLVQKDSIVRGATGGARRSVCLPSGVYAWFMHASGWGGTCADIEANPVPVPLAGQHPADRKKCSYLCFRHLFRAGQKVALVDSQRP
jgi:hypothetical protein